MNVDAEPFPPPSRSQPPAPDRSPAATDALAPAEPIGAPTAARPPALRPALPPSLPRTLPPAAPSTSGASTPGASTSGASSRRGADPEPPADDAVASVGFRRDWFVLLYCGALMAAAVVLTIVASGRFGQPRHHIPFLALAAAFVASELIVVHVYHDAHSHSFSLSEIVIVAGLMSARPATVVVAQAVAVLIVFAGIRGLKPVKVAFNLGQFALCTLATIYLFHALGGTEATELRTWVAVLVALGSTAVLGGLLVSLVIAISGGQVTPHGMLRMLGYGLSTGLGNGVLVLTAAALWSLSPWMALFTAVPLAVLVVAYRGYIAQRRRSETIEFLYQATMALHDAPNLDDGLISVLEHARQALRVHLAQAVIYTTGGDAVTSIASSDPGERLRMGPLAPLVGHTCRQILEHLDTATVLDPKNPRHQSLLAAVGSRAAVASPLQIDGRTAGLLFIGDRLSELSPFGPDDAKLVNLLANQVNVALARGALEHSLSELIELERKLSHQAYHDPLTGLANRALFNERLGQALADATVPHAVLVIDLDDFKTVNDSLGHAAGDDLLTTIASRIDSTLRAGDLTARLGGDEFAVLLDRIGSISSAAAMASRILDRLAEPVRVAGREIMARASIGIALADGSHKQVGEVLRDADMALYRAKGLGKNRYALYESGMHDEVTQRLALSAALGQAMERDELQVRYQPVVDLVSGHVRGVEALVRWQHSVLSDIGPAEFIPIAEQTGLIVPIGRWVLQEACTQLAKWERMTKDGQEVTVSVNVSARQLQDPDFVSEVRDLVGRLGVNPSHLVFELTESVLIEDSVSIAATLAELKSIGIRLAIDDFGTGYSSMNYVSRFPIDVLKIDKSFVSSMASSPTSTALVAAMVQLANSLGLIAIAEGVEEPEQVEVLRRLGCRLGQGYLWSVPVPASHVERLLLGTVQLVH